MHDAVWLEPEVCWCRRNGRCALADRNTPPCRDRCVLCQQPIQPVAAAAPARARTRYDYYGLVLREERSGGATLVASEALLVDAAK